MFNLSLTSDGSHSLYSEKFEAYYHSTHGAIQETQVVFIEAGLTEKLNKVNDSISILELGFGTGLNAFMTFLEALHCGKNINYTTYELFPVGYEIASTLNYVEKLSAEKYYNVFREMHESLNESKVLELSDTNLFHFNFVNDDFENIDCKSCFDIVYFDAFAPEVQPGLWTEVFLQKMFDALKKDGLIVTYCAKGSFKRALKSVGFFVESLPGPKGKREMTRALKC